MRKDRVFEPTIASLQDYVCPDWFRDAKLGIYVHWGVYSVAEWGEWYPRHMYIEERPEHQHHVETYGHPSVFGYKDLIPLWKAEKFDPDELVSLFKRAGARYFTPCAVHHDNFDLWDSAHHDWNAVNMGPGMDITGMWRQATLDHGLRFGVTTHLARSYSWFNVNKGTDTAGAYAGVPYDGNDPQYQNFYHEPHPDTDLRHPLNPPAHWRKTWALRIKDLLDHYHPDHLYFDGAVPFQGDDAGRTGLEVLAYYYNESVRLHGGKQECVMCLKNIPDHGLYVDGIATLDLERQRAGEIRSNPWQTDTSIGPWGYDVRRPYRAVGEIIHEFVDIVSKNGNMLLNVPPRANGTLDGDTRQILLEIGGWMDVNGEAIYGTRPWHTCGADELRYTRKGDSLYAIVLEWPGEGNGLVIPRSVLGEGVSPVSDVSLLGYNGELAWSQCDEGLCVTCPPAPCDYACALKVRL